MDNILSVSLNIKASHAGKINNNFVLYTPRSMKRGSETLILPFKKHLQNLHRGDAVGVINEASFMDYSDKYSDEIATISQKIDTAHNPAELVSAVKELVSHPEYNNSNYKGLGVLQVSAELYNEPLIQELATGSNKGKVSVGGNSRQVYCSVCAELFTKNHKHVKGKNYNGETCFAIYDDMVLDHIGFVPDPADDKTETVIVSPISDSMSGDDASVSIEYIKIQDNIQGKVNKMNLEELKQKLKADAGYSVSLVSDITDTQKTALVENLASTQKHQRASSFLFSDEKLLPINTKENIALAKLVVDQLEDGAVKDGYLALLKVQLEKHFAADEDTLEVLKAFGIEEAKQEPQIPTEPAKVDETGAPVTAPVQFSEEVLKELAQQIVTSVIEGLKPTPEQTAAIADATQLEVILNRNKQLESDIAAYDIQNNELTNKYKDSIITQILLHKGIDSQDPYVEVLKQRDLASLSVLLEDVQHDLSRVTQTASVTTKEPDAPSAKTDDEPNKVIEKAPIQDSITANNTATENAPITSLPSVRDVGLKEYMRQKQLLQSSNK
jgi:hypothetical protein